MRRVMMSALMALAGLSACSPAAPGAPLAAGGHDLVCEAIFNQLVGTLVLESKANIALTLDDAHYTVTDVTVTQPWTGRPELDPWRLFLKGRERPVAGTQGDVVTLFNLGQPPRPFTIDRQSGDLNWSDAGPMGEVEYFGGCKPAA